MADTREPKPLTRVALVGRHATPGVAEPLTRLAGFLTTHGHEVLLEAETAANSALASYPSAPASELGGRVDVAVVIGGDGTLLAMARQLAPLDIPLIGVNLGRLGFLTDIPLADMEASLAKMLAGHYIEERRTLLSAVVEQQGGIAGRALAVNEVVVSRGSLGGMIDLAVEIDGGFVYAMRADGLIVATPTGSTAYALSAQGPILHPRVPAVVLVPVAPHALTNRPIAISETSTIVITLLRGKDAAAHADGQAHFGLQENDRVVIARAAHPARLLHPEGYDHFAMLREKLHWSATPEQVRPATYAAC
ncbi:MAG TPA: NAD kinase [Casimicrobiaceae bacterium]|nr:NAD kinase [Casimicrobiaceae bacterium]